MESRNIWRSKRLVFRAVDEGDEEFLQTLNQYGSDSYQNASGALPVPQGKAGAVQHREGLQKLLLGVIICLPTPVAATVPVDGSAVASKPTPIGSMGLTPNEPRYSCHRNTNLGVNIVTPYQGRGYGTEAILWGLEWAFRHANLHRVKIGAFEWNEGAARLYGKLGFVVEGREREAWWYDGRYRDCVWMSMLDREWRERYGGREGLDRNEVVAGAEK